ncbi:MAG: HAD family hydrolase [Synergistaceae bacterium]|nr:HAD family hydrolase [Synergistaceae bacterium]
MSYRDPVMAMCYDFDGTLAPGNMQEHDFFPDLKISPAEFWEESNALAREHEVDPILAYMKLMLDKARMSGKVQISRSAFRKYGKAVDLFRGVKSWFGDINEYAAKNGVRLEHYIISSGLREMIQGTAISTHVKEIYASSFIYDQHGVAVWPANAVNYTTKTQYLYRINKGIENITDNESVNEFVPEEDRRIPFSRMLFIGDGSTDVPCMKLVKNQGGHSIAVYSEDKEGSRDYAIRLLHDGRVNFIAEGIYTKSSKMFKYTSSVIDMVAASYRLYSLTKSVSQLP